LLALTWAVAERLSARAAAAAGAIAIAASTVAAIPQVRTWQDSVTVFQRALAVTRDNALAHLNLGVALMDRNDLPAAREEFRRTLVIRPQSALAWNDLARTETLLGHDLAAAEAYQQSLKLNPDQRQALLFYGRLLKKHEKWPAAQVLFEHLREIAPELPQPWQELGEVYAAQGKNAEARAAWEQLLKMRPGDEALRKRLEALPQN
jgi:Tfp pilus assembly protein PilF